MRRNAKTKECATNACTNTSASKQEAIQGKCKGFMCPRGLALDYPFAEVLLSWAEKGCEVDCGKNWSKEQIIAAIECRPHISAKTKKATAYEWKEAEEKS